MNENDGQWQYKPDGKTAAQPADLSALNSPSPRTDRPQNDTSLTWTASEYIDHARGPVWYMVLVVGTAALAAAIYLLTKDYFTTGAIIILGIIVSIFSTQKPKQATYELSARGLQAGNKNYPLSLFKSFAIIRENALCSLNLIPIKRFMPTISVYFDPAQQNKIVEILGSHLPLQKGGLDPIERLSRRLRF